MEREIYKELQIAFIVRMSDGLQIEKEVIGRFPDATPAAETAE